MICSLLQSFLCKAFYSKFSLSIKLMNIFDLYFSRKITSLWYIGTWCLAASKFMETVCEKVGINPLVIPRQQWGDTQIVCLEVGAMDDMKGEMKNRRERRKRWWIRMIPGAWKMKGYLKSVFYFWILNFLEVFFQSCYLWKQPLMQMDCLFFWENRYVEEYLRDQWELIHSLLRGKKHSVSMSVTNWKWLFPPTLHFNTMSHQERSSYSKEKSFNLTCTVIVQWGRKPICLENHTRATLLYTIEIISVPKPRSVLYQDQVLWFQRKIQSW